MKLMPSLISAGRLFSSPALSRVEGAPSFSFAFPGNIGNCASGVLERFANNPLTSLIEIAKFRFCPFFKKKHTTPITSPFSLKTGPPLLPGEIGADI